MTRRPDDPSATPETPARALVSCTADHGIAVIELNDPPANTYSYEMMQALDAAILRARMDESVHVLVLRGAGDRFFCAGADIRTLARVTPAYKYNFCLHANETLNRLEQTPKLVIAAINGHCVGGGLEVALAADIRLARAGGGRTGLPELKIGLPEVTLGVLPGTGGTQRLARLVGRARALEMLATGRTFTPEEAAAAGIVTQVLHAEGWWDRALEYARQFTPPGKAAKAVGAIKRAVVSGSEMSFAEGLALERELQQQLFQSADAAEGIAAYVEKRSPKFRGI